MRFAYVSVLTCLGSMPLIAGGCAANRPEVSVDLSSGLEVATAAEATYAARPHAAAAAVAALMTYEASVARTS